MNGGNTGFDDLMNYKVKQPNLSGAGATGFDDLVNQPQDPSLLDRAKGFLTSIDEAYEEGRAERKAQLEKTKSNVLNTLSDYAANAGKAIENYGNEITAAGERAMEAYNNGESINMEDPTQGYEGENYSRAKMNAYNELVGKPAGYAAITPYMPAPIKAIGGALAVPTLLDSTAQTYNQNIEKNDGTPVTSTAIQTLINPVWEPVKEVATHPGEFAQSLVDNPLEVWDKVFLPGAMIHCAGKLAKKATPKRISEPLEAHVIDPVKSGLANAKGRFFDSFKRGGETGFDDLARDTEAGTSYYAESNLPPDVDTQYSNPADILYEKVKQQESGGTYDQTNSDSGAYGNIQWMPDTWKAEAERVLGDREAPMTPENQEMVGRAYLNRLYQELDGDERAVAASIYAGEGYGKALHEGKPPYDPNVRVNEAGNLDPNGKYPSVNEYIEQVLQRNVERARPIYGQEAPRTVNDFSEDVSRPAPEETDLNLMRDPVEQSAKNPFIIDSTNGLYKTLKEKQGKQAQEMIKNLGYDSVVVVDSVGNRVLETIDFGQKTKPRQTNAAGADLVKDITPEELFKDDVQARKASQLHIILKENPMHDDYHTGIRTIEDINTAEEAFKNPIADGGGTNPDFTANMMKDSLKTGYVTVYSSQPIKAGAFITPSKMMANDYAGGEYAPVEKYFKNSTRSARPEKSYFAAETNKSSEVVSDSAKIITPEELANHIKDGTIPIETFRTYDEQAFLHFRKLSEQQKYKYASDNTIELSKGIKDSDGTLVKVMFDENNANAINDAVNHFISGAGKSGGSVTVNDVRAFATGLIKDTIQSPDAKILQKNGRTAYVSLWRGNKNITHLVAVERDVTGNGKIITSLAAKDHKHRSNNAMNTLYSAIKNADRIKSISVNLQGRLSKYLRPPSSDRVSTPDTRLRPSGNSIVAEGTGKVNSVKNERSFMNNPIEEAATDRLTTWQKETISRKQILDDVNKIFGATVKKGRVGKKGVSGWYNYNTDVIRTKNFGDPRTLMHELGHYVDGKFKFSDRPGFDTEFSDVIHKRFGKAYDKGGIETIRKEGIAEFFHDYVTSRKKAAAEFPAFYDEFKRILDSDKDLRAAVDKLSYVGNQWYAQPVWERMKGSVSFSDSIGRKTLVTALKDGELGEVGKAAYNNLYTKIIDELHPLEELAKIAEQLTGKKLSVGDNPFLQAWLARGWAGKAEALLQHGDKDLGVKAFKDIIRQIPEKQLKDFSAYLTALRELDMNKWNESLTASESPIITRFTKTECIEAIDHYNKNSKFAVAAHEIYKYNDALLTFAVKGGMLSMKAAVEMKQKYPHYVPFFREFYEATEAQGKGAGKGFTNVSAVTKKMKGSTLDVVDPLESMIKNTFSIMNAIERNKVGQSIVKLSKINGMGPLIEKVSGVAKVTDHSFSVWENGKKVVYNTTPELYQAFKMLNPEGANMFTKILSYPAKWLRAGATLGPEFILRNPVRDMISASIYSKHGFIPVVDTLKGLGLYLQKGETYWEYMRSGAAQANLVSLDRNYLSGQMRELLQRPSVKKMITTNPIEVLRGLSEATEMATRLAEFHNVRQGYTGIGNRLFSKKRNPGSIQEAALESRDVTLDFSRIGSHTKSLNKTIAFFNAALQGTDKMVRAWRENPLDMTVKTAMCITMPSVLLWYLNKDDPRYQELPQWQKDIFWIIPTKDTLIKIPKPFELGILFGTVPERMLQWDYDKKRKQKGAGFKGLAGSVLDSMAPSFLPTSLVPAIEAITNHSFFMDRDIVPQSQMNTIPELQYGPYTSAIGRKIGETFGVSPRIVDNTIRGYGGSLSGLGLSLTDQMAGLNETRPAKRFSEQPGIRGFTATPYASSESVQQIYDAYDRQLKLFNASRELHRKMDGFDQSEFEQMKEAMKSFQNINRAKNAVMKSSLSSEAKRKRLDEIQMAQVRIARRALGKDPIR